MKNFEKLWKKKEKDQFEGFVYITCYKHYPTNRLIFFHQRTRDNYTFWSDEKFGATADLKYWVHDFYKHPITLGKQ